MTRGRRRNHITVSGPAKAKRNDEFEIEGTESVFIDDLRARGSISAAQHRAGQNLLREITTKNTRAADVMWSMPSSTRAHCEAILVDGMKLVDYGRKVQGFKDDAKCYAWALAGLRSVLDAAASFYSKRVYGNDEG